MYNWIDINIHEPETLAELNWSDNNKIQANEFNLDIRSEAKFDWNKKKSKYLRQWWSILRLFDLSCLFWNKDEMKIILNLVLRLSWNTLCSASSILINKSTLQYLNNNTRAENCLEKMKVFHSIWFNASWDAHNPLNKKKFERMVKQKNKLVALMIIISSREIYRIQRCLIRKTRRFAFHFCSLDFVNSKTFLNIIASIVYGI